MTALETPDQGVGVAWNKLEILLSVPVLMVTSAGSISHWPFAPATTEALAPMPNWWPEVSIWPPAPTLAPLPAPTARRLPSTWVRLPAKLTLDHSTTLPPLPWAVALASMLAPASMPTVLAWRRLPLPCQSPPTNTVPPPVEPLALMLLPAPKRMLSPVRATWPPWALSLFTLMRPLWMTLAPAPVAVPEPVPASSTMRPPTWLTP